MKKSFITGLLTATLGVAQSGYVTVGGGVGPASGNFEPTVHGTILLNGGVDFWRFHGIGLGVEIPVGLFGSESSDAFPGHSGNAGMYREWVTAVVTPGLRVRLLPEGRVSPWLSLGVGVAQVHRVGTIFQSIFGQTFAMQTDSNLTVPLAPAVGVDFGLTHRWFLRGEMRNYLFKTPQAGFVSSEQYWNRWNYNPVFGASVGFKF
jgi:hypothetical protein